MNPFILVTCFYVQMCNICARSPSIENMKPIRVMKSTMHISLRVVMAEWLRQRTGDPVVPNVVSLNTTTGQILRREFATVRLGVSICDRNLPYFTCVAAH